MTEFDSFGEIDAGNNAISMVDEDGSESGYHMLATKKDGDCLYMLVEEESPGGSTQSGELVAEVLIFKCVDDGESEDMVFELVEEDHESFELAFELFKEDFDELGIEY